MALRPWWDSEDELSNRLFGNIPGVQNPGLFTDGATGGVSRGSTSAQNPAGNRDNYIYRPFNGMLPQQGNSQTATSPFLRQQPQQAPAGVMPKMTPLAAPVQQTRRMIPNSPYDMYQAARMRALQSVPNQKRPQNVVFHMGKKTLTDFASAPKKMGGGIKATRDIRGNLKTSADGYTPRTIQRLDRNAVAPKVAGVNQITGQKYYSSPGGLKAMKKESRNILSPQKLAPQNQAELRAMFKGRGFSDEEIDKFFYNGKVPA